MKTYLIHTIEEEYFCISTDLDIEIWVEEYEAEHNKALEHLGIEINWIVEYDLVEDPDSVETEEWWAA